jgi:hypothetical protein
LPLITQLAVDHRKPQRRTQPIAVLESPKGKRRKKAPILPRTCCTQQKMEPYFHARTTDDMDDMA